MGCKKLPVIDDLQVVPVMASMILCALYELIFANDVRSAIEVAIEEDSKRILIDIALQKVETTA